MLQVSGCGGALRSVRSTMPPLNLNMDFLSLQEKLGTGFQASAVAGALVKQKMAEKIYNDALDAAIRSDGVRALNLDRNGRDILGRDSLINR